MHGPGAAGAYARRRAHARWGRACTVVAHRFAHRRARGCTPRCTPGERLPGWLPRRARRASGSKTCIFNPRSHSRIQKRSIQKRSWDRSPLARPGSFADRCDHGRRGIVNGVDLCARSPIMSGRPAHNPAGCGAGSVPPACFSGECRRVWAAAGGVYSPRAGADVLSDPPPDRAGGAFGAPFGGAFGGGSARRHAARGGRVGGATCVGLGVSSAQRMRYDIHDHPVARYASVTQMRPWTGGWHG
ncbi:hypothetical protein FF36_06000 [Frankia torreyi]|uniref:Uncharacterized protein n=1 Tax=Frankia torreyi TaxID=1856 RepID=A0A0D8B6M8_9ACTN|nr:hypothetical protein FF36_06000 [Frankia torreyi]